jgi:hypothetical protein
MINELKRHVADATAPSRHLDCAMHEVLTGDLCCCKDDVMKRANWRVGRMLTEGGGELLWREVPCYSRIFDEIAGAVPKDLAIKLTSNTPRVFEVATRLDLGPIKKWRASIWIPEKMIQVAIGEHNVSAALALCAAELDRLTGPKGSAEVGGHG